MFRFVTLALPLLLLILALFDATAEAVRWTPRALRDLPPRVLFGTWMLQAAGLVGLYLLIRGRAGRWWLDGLVAGWTAWLFRGPLVVIAVVAVAGQPHRAWWRLAISWWWLYGLCGLVLAALARRLIVDGSGPPPAPPEPKPIARQTDSGEAPGAHREPPAAPDAESPVAPSPSVDASRPPSPAPDTEPPDLPAPPEDESR